MIAGGGKVLFLRNESASKWHFIFATYFKPNASYRNVFDKIFAFECGLLQ